MLNSSNQVSPSTWILLPLSDQPIQGKSEYEPVYVNSLTYGRLGNHCSLETEIESYEFAETCIKKEFDRIFSKKTTALNKEEEEKFLKIQNSKC